jgi:hypothetical protein
MPADEILNLKILEPAMGSAAFLVETTNQLADLYLERKQQEVGKTIPQEGVLLERQKVRAFISDRNCFGVDLNPVAVELGAISLWLNSLHRSSFSPWFGDQLHAGNSLIGARRAAYDPSLLKGKKKGDLWFNFPPAEIGWKGAWPNGYVWQFLLPAEDMAAFDKDKSITEFAGAAQERIREWRKGGFFDKFEPHEVKLVQKLSLIVDQLFEEVADSLASSRIATNDAIALWPDVEIEGAQRESFRDKQRRLEKLTGDDHAANTLPYKRLKTAMDAWCALWLWPLDKAHFLPSRTEFLNGMAMILEGGFSADGSLAAPSIAEFADPAPDMFGMMEPDAPAKDLFVAANKRQASLFRETNVEALVEAWDWLGVAVQVAEQARFAHLDLMFADVLKARGGFDIIVGNPPWAKPSWNEGLILADIDPFYLGLSASAAKKILPEALAKSKGEVRFLREFVATRGAMEITSSEVMHPFAGGGSNNLYRCFIDLSFRLVSENGFIAMIHQDGHLGDPKSGIFRRHWYSRIAKHFSFMNTIKTKNFADAAHYMRFSQNIYRGFSVQPEFEQFTNAFLASQIEDSYSHDGTGAIPDIKGPDGNWDTRGHRNRVIQIDHAALSVIHSLSEEDKIPVNQARFIQPYSAQTLEVFRQMASFPKLDTAIPHRKVSTISASGERIDEVSLWHMNRLWDETGAQNSGTISRITAFRPAQEMILQGPHIHVANPLYKTPRAVSRQKGDYDVIDLNVIPINYAPRSNYAPKLDFDKYKSMITKCKWDNTKAHTDFFRLALRRMINLNSERSLITAIIPPKMAHINAVESISFYEEFNTLTLLTITTSIVYDFLLKISGITNLFQADIARFPWIYPGNTSIHRGLRLTCLTDAYAELWDRHASILSPLSWSSNDPRLAFEGPIQGPNSWNRTAGLRTEFARRLALVEIDVLVAQALGLTIEQLIEIYRIYFPVLQQYEAATWYDQRGRTVWTASKGLPGIGWLNDKGKSPSRKEWDTILASNPSELRCTATIDFLPNGPHQVERVFEGPFETCDRIEDYKRAWVYFEAQREKGLVV